MVVVETMYQGFYEVKGEPTLTLDGYSVVRTQYLFDVFGCLYQIIMRYFRKNVVDNMSPYVMMELIEHTIVSINTRKTTTQITPLRTPVPGYQRLTINRTMVMQV
jgi:hypothetical protein